MIILSIVFTAGVGNTVASTDLVCDLLAKVITIAHDLHMIPLNNGIDQHIIIP